MISVSFGCFCVMNAQAPMWIFMHLIVGSDTLLPYPKHTMHLPGAPKKYVCSTGWNSSVTKGYNYWIENSWHMVKILNISKHLLKSTLDTSL